MGKKSKKKSSKNTRVASASASPNNEYSPPSPPTLAPKDATCWICLDDEPDEDGEPIVRDCSCRGDSGFAHTSCIVKYCRDKSEWRTQHPTDELFLTWKNCHCCHQDYRGQLSLDMADEMLSFCNKNPFLEMEALRMKMHAIGNLAGTEAYPLLKEGDAAGLRILYIVEQVRAQNPPPLPRRVSIVEANTYLCLGQNAGMRDAPEALKYFEKYLDASKAIKDEFGIKDAEAHIREEKSRQGILPIDIKSLRKAYNLTVEQAGENSPVAIIAAVRLAIELLVKNCTIESERIFTKIVALSRRVHGIDHQETKWVESKFQQARLRQVWCYKNVPLEEIHQFMGYTDSNKEKCALQGMVTGKRITADAKAIIPLPGCPVICHGLKNASHLNGKMGDVRSFDKKTGRVGVHFEEKGTKPCLVKGENLYVVIDVTKGE